jgi:hypothetical protein
MSQKAAQRAVLKPPAPVPTLFTIQKRKKRQREFTVSREFRLNSETAQRLETLSREKGMAVNVIANLAIRRTVEWEPLVEKVGIVSAQKATLRFLWDNLPEEKARDLGRRHGGEAGAEILTFWFHKFSFETMLEAARLFGAEYGGVYTFQHDYTDGAHTIIMHHDLGKNFTAYLKESFSATLRLLMLDFDVTESEKQLFIRVRR